MEKELTSSLKITPYSSGDISTAGYTGWVAMRDYANFLVTAVLSVASSTGITELKLYCAEDASETHATLLSSHAVGTAVDSVGEMILLETNAAAIKALGVANSYNFTHISARVKCADSTGRAIITYIQGNPRFAAADLTADTAA